MTRLEILNSYDVDSAGIIHSPGQFEGEMLYVPYYWSIYLDGWSDRDDGHVLGFDINKEDKLMFPELRKRRTVNLYQRSDGFVCEA